MINWILNKITWDYNEKQLKSINPIVWEINIWYEKYKSLSDNEIKAKTDEFKQRYKDGESLDALLPEWFAVVKSACERMLGMKLDVKGKELVWDMLPYDVQLIWGIVLHQGKIAEMKTWEGKTLVAVAPAYLNALTGKSVHIVTVNDYLASRDAEWMWYLYNRLGLTVWSITKHTPLQNHKIEYEKDIVYVENTELGFDYLRDNLEKKVENRRLMNRWLFYAIVDEADSVLIDEARTPMIISQPNNDPIDKYVHYSQVIRNLVPSASKKKVSKWFLAEMLKDKKDEDNQDDWGDYFIDEKSKSVSLTEHGISKLENMLGVEHLYRDLGYEEIHHIENALLARWAYENGKDYIVHGNEVLIVDENTGRTMPGRRFQWWLHQAIEAKEGISIKNEAKTIGSITYQNFFKLYEKISGMTGTALTEAEEFEKIYELETISIPTNREILRVDRNDKVFFDQNAKWSSVVDNIKYYHEIGQPILIWTSSVYTSELVSELLRKQNINHYVLNAKFHEQEADIVGNAGKIWWVVVATNMAWRGTDIKLDKGLNEKLAENYAKRVASEIKKWNSVQLDINSKYEYDLIMSALENIR